MPQKDVAAYVRQALTPLIEGMGFEVVDVEYVKKSNGMNLTIYADIARGITLDDCEAIHNAINPVIDELDPTGEQPYTLNVSSPGLDRPFKTQRDYERNYGKEVEVKLYAPLKGKKMYEGVLTQKTEHTLTILTEQGECQLECGKIALVRPLVKFES